MAAPIRGRSRAPALRPRLSAQGECTACVGGELTVTTTAAAAEGAVAFTATAALANASADAWLAPPVAAALRRRLKHAQLGQVTGAAALHRAAGDGAAADAARAQALALALAPPRLVWPGLTSMVATRPASCDAPADEGGGGGGGGGGASPPRCEGGGAEGALDEEQLELGGLVGASPVAGGALRADLASEASALTGRSGGGLAGGTIGIGVAGAVVLALLGAGAAWLVRRRRLRRATLQKNAGAGAGRVAYQRQRSSALGAPAQQPAAEMVVVQPLDDAPAA